MYHSSDTLYVNDRVICSLIAFVCKNVDPSAFSAMIHEKYILFSFGYTIYIINQI